MHTFRASVQYGDWEGTASADNGDEMSIESLLEDKGLINRDTEMLVGVEIWVGENHGGESKPPSIHCLIAERTGNFDNLAAKIKSASGPVTVREVDVELTMDQFIGLFKRFAVVLTRRGLNLIDRDYTIG